LLAVYVVGFAALFLTPTVAVVITLQIVQRWMNFAIANPARQVFFTVIGREEKYKVKNLIDVVVYAARTLCTVGFSTACRRRAGGRSDGRR